jgi:hypothetical protein
MLVVYLNPSALSPVYLFAVTSQLSCHIDYNVGSIEWSSELCGIIFGRYISSRTSIRPKVISKFPDVRAIAIYRRCYPRMLPSQGAALSSLIGLAYNANGLAR